MKDKASFLALALTSFLCSARAQDRGAIEEVLSRPIEDFSAQGQDGRVVLEGLGAAYHFPVIVDSDVQGAVSFELHNASVGTVVEAICQARGWSYEASDRGYLLVRKFVTRIYPVDYLQMTQSGSSSASVNLSESASGALSAGNAPGSGSGTSAQLAGNALPGTASSSTSGTSTLSVVQQNDADFWGRLEGDLKGMIGDGESLLVNRFAGIVQIRGSLRTHRVVEGYLKRVLQRVGRQARISVKIVEVDLNDQSKAGIDWEIARESLGRISKTAVTLSGVSSITGSLAQLGSVVLDPPTFSGTLSAGGVQAAISALSEQGTVRVESKPEIAALNNQTAFVQVSEDQPFFSRTSTTTINAGGLSQAGTQPIVSTNYSESTVSFGNVLEITVQIADDLTTKLSLSPAMTELKGTVTSPDGQETAPVTGTKRARTTLALRNHETAVIGGFITETKGNERRGVPVLAAVPFIGNAFSTATRVRTRTELVFLVTVNAEEPREIKTTAPEEDSPGTGGVPRPRRVERIGLGGDMT